MSFHGSSKFLNRLTNSGWIEGNNPPPTLSAILTKRLNPSEDLRSNRAAMFWQKSLALVLDSTSKAWGVGGVGTWL